MFSRDNGGGRTPDEGMDPGPGTAGSGAPSESESSERRYAGVEEKNPKKALI